MASSRYEAIDDFEKGEASSFIPNEHLNSLQSRPSTLRTTLFSIGIFLLGVFSTLAVQPLKSHFYSGSWHATPFQEEKLLPAEAYQLEQVRFKTPVDFAPNGHEFLVTQPGETMYIGDTTPEIDRAWEELLWGRYFSISEDEAKSVWGDSYADYWDPVRSGYTGGFDMFHQMHCLNQIRQALHRDVYPETHVHGPVHLDHCINQIRQSLMCWGSTAIIGQKYFLGYNASYVASDVVHTCRKFEPIRDFVSERFNGSLFVQRPSGWIDHESNAF